MLKNMVSLCVIFFIVFVMSAGLAHCQDDTAAVVKTLEGRVVSVDPQGFNITIKTYENIVFSVPLSAKLTSQDGFDIQLSDINTGNYVTVDYYDNRAGEHIAKNINVEYNR